VKFLLDVSVLISLGAIEHEFHVRAARWAGRQATDHSAEFATCSITELGFVRVIAQAPQYGITVAQAQELLRRIKNGPNARFTFIADDHDVSRLPGWVKTARQTTDGHLAHLARANGAVLATFDRKTPGAFLIPE
jgi:uncharacterized protein